MYGGHRVFRQSPCSLATGKMAFNATKVARAPACFTESKTPMFHKRLKTTSDEFSSHVNIDHGVSMYLSLYSLIEI